MGQHSYHISQNFAHFILDQTCAIQSIPAPTFHETLRAEYFLEKFRVLGLSDCQKDKVGNVLARLPGSEMENGPHINTPRPLVLCAHMDTVHPMNTPLTIDRQPDRIVGPGIGDNALGLAAVIGIVQKIKDAGIMLPGDLWVALNVCEEGLGDLRGIQEIVNRFEDAPLAYLIVEGMGLGNILNRGLGVERYKISIDTPGGHSWVDYGQPSAIHEIAKLINQITSINVPALPCSTINVGIIHGGTSINTIAPHAWMELDLRSESSTVLARMVSDVQKICKGMGRSHVSVRMERIGKRLAGQLSQTHPLVGLAQDVLRTISVEPRLDIASTDANLPLSRGYPAICIGITQGDNAHTLDEYILKEPVRLGLEQLYLLVTQAWEKIT